MPAGSSERPARAFAHMVHTAEHADDLKRAAGLKAGRKMKDPVYSYSLSWHPSERPTRADMMGAAKETLAALGLASHQAVFIAHNDTEHPHIHVIANRVCPETGRAATMGKDRLILSDWALRYRKERGEEHFCPERAANKAKREQGKWTKHRPTSRKEQYEWKKSQSDNLWDGYRAQRDSLKGKRKSQSAALEAQKEARIAARRREVKAMFKPTWRDMYKRQREETREFDTGWIGRINVALTMPRHKVLGAFLAILDGNAVRQEMLNRQAAEKRQVSNHHLQAVREAVREVNKAWKYDRNQLYASWKEQDAVRLREAKTMSDEIWKKDKADREPSNDAKPKRGRRTFAERANAEKTSEHKAARTERAKARSRSRPRGGRGRSFTPD